MAQFKVGDVIRREWVDGYWVEREVTDTESDGLVCATVIRSNQGCITSVLNAYAGSLFAVGYKIIGNVRSRVTVDSLDYINNKDLDDQDKQIIKEFLDAHV